MKKVMFLHNFDSCGNDCPYYKYNPTNGKTHCEFFSPAKFIHPAIIPIGEKFPEFCELVDDEIFNGIVG